jgi:threonine/homoserine/homoserine lactone efflux protein
MFNTTLLMAFVPTFLLVSFTPGLCMTLALTLGLTHGVRLTLWMMIGELAGVALVAISTVMGIAALMLAAPILFTVLKMGGGAYLAYMGIQMWLSRGQVSIDMTADSATKSVSRFGLMTQGFVTAVANPKGWAFFMVLLPPFIDASLPLAAQLMVLIAIILLIEFVALMSYAAGGQTLKAWLHTPASVRKLNKISGGLLVGVGGWLAFGH